MGYKEVIGYTLGVLTVVVVSGIFMKPLRTVAKFLLNSLGGIALCMIINYAFARWGIHIGINPVTAVLLGMLGVPGLIMILIAQIFC